MAVPVSASRSAESRMSSLSVFVLIVARLPPVSFAIVPVESWRT
jgi:hypothetical protein